jgi:hypothetical protein
MGAIEVIIQGEKSWGRGQEMLLRTSPGKTRFLRVSQAVAVAPRTSALAFSIRLWPFGPHKRIDLSGGEKGGWEKGVRKGGGAAAADESHACLCDHPTQLLRRMPCCSCVLLLIEVLLKGHKVRCLEKLLLLLLLLRRRRRRRRRRRERVSVL